MVYNAQQQLQKSLSLHQSGQTDEAIKICQNILILLPKEPNTLQLLGAFKKAKGDYTAAEKFMRASLAANGKQPHVHNNLGNLLFESGKYEAAIQCYKKATTLNTIYADAWFNWAIVLEKQGKIAEGFKLIEKAIFHAPNQGKHYNLLGLLHKKEENYPGAIKAFEKSLQLHPNHLATIHNLGTVYREAERYREAEKCFNYVLTHKADQVETWEAIGSLYHSTEDFDRSIVAYHKLLTLEPENLKIHRVVNNMMWETGRHDGFLGSYRRAMADRPDSPHIVAAYAEELCLGGHYDPASEIIEQALKRQGEYPELYHCLAQIKRLNGDKESARHLLEKTLQMVTDNDEYFTDYAQLLLEAGDYEEALKQADLAEKINPDYQKIWSIKGDCWQLLDDERYYWLNDFENFIQPLDIEVPEGFAHIEDFNEALDEALTKLHITNVNPRDQSLKGGTQTIGDLYQNRHPLIQKLGKAIFDTALRYIAALPDDESHPHLRRKTQKIKFAGAWSVRLKQDGYHVNHYHSKGWISGPYYVNLPDVLNNSGEDGEKPGWVNFGASRYGPEESRKPERIIKPQAGLQVFFPSYMWHGTNAFQSDETRMVASCDMIPL